MDVELAEELVNQLGSSLERLETQHAALFQFLKDQGVVTDEQLAPYLGQAGKASGVRWRAARIRLESLISAEKSREEDAAEKEKQLRSGEQAPSQSQAKEGREAEGQAKEAKNQKEEESGKAAPPQEEAGTNAEAQAVGSQSNSEKDKT